MVKRSIVILVVLLLASAAVNSAMAATRTFKPINIGSGGATTSNSIRSGGIASIASIIFESVGSRNFNNFLPVSYEDPANHFDWSEFFGWVQPD
jgi:hypothetical protein